MNGYEEDHYDRSQGEDADADDGALDDDGSSFGTFSSSFSGRSARDYHHYKLDRHANQDSKDAFDKSW